MTGLAARLRPAGATGSFDRRLIAPMVLGAILNPVNSSMIAVSLVPIGVAFGAPPAETAWLVSALYLATATGQPVVGKLVDLFGVRRVFLAGTALAGIARVIGTLAPNLGTLIVARVILGFGTCAGYPVAMTPATGGCCCSPPRRRPRSPSASCTSPTRSWTCGCSAATAR